MARWISRRRWVLRSVSGTHDNHRHAKSILLTDGGHFDNTGLYALLRRGCRLIIVADATAEPEISGWSGMRPIDKAAYFADLRDVESKIRTDFGAELEMDWSRFDPRHGDGLMLEGSIGLPVATADGDGVWERTIVLYLRAAYEVDALRTTGSYVDRAKALDGSFPNRSTADQDYDENLMNSMVELGYRAVVDNAAIIEDRMKAVRGAPARQPPGSIVR